MHTLRRNKKKIMILGGSYHQLPAIIQAKKLGYFVITVDYLPNNIGHQYSDLYFNVSTKDKIGVLAIAEQEKIESILAFASEPAAITTAFVAERLRLPSSSLKSVITLSGKDYFREFQRINGLHCPKFQIDQSTSCLGCEPSRRRALALSLTYRDDRGRHNDQW
jgi:hypothetical protein